MGDGEGLASEEGPKLEEVLLKRTVRGGIVTAGAFHFDAKEGGTNDESFGGHGDVVLRGNSEAGGTTKPIGTFHADEFGDHEVEGFVIEEGFVKPPSEGAGVVEGGIDDVWIFGKDILPVAHPAVGPAWVGEEAVDGSGALGG